MSNSQIENLKEDALQLFSEEKYEELNSCLHKMVELGDPWGMHYLAGNYFYGYGVPPDHPKANELYLKAANLGFSDSQMVIGNNLCGGNGIKKNFPEGMVWLEKAANKNNGYANFQGYTIRIKFLRESSGA
jgi:hypothetical protein